MIQVTMINTTKFHEYDLIENKQSRQRQSKKASEPSTCFSFRLLDI
jgi:hypothetical protein